METQSTHQSFGDLIQGDKPVLVDFSAEWCGPCKMMPPILKELKQMTGDNLIILKMDVDRNPQVANAYQIQAVPTLMVFQNGEVKWRQSGVMNARELKRVVDQYVK
ncbi:thioredoxin [Chitinophaga agrisoli]|uniref:Thioredoxin n=1 Tax=Chitinophaga agrisoli TaxID=2607653 RepID=A0A5B2VM19_9BACT|nr:thioredoxin [Chitinophaga agrisoli]KAA2239975.1 thioredoxin [Chitinophaga agrisoli]